MTKRDQFVDIAAVLTDAGLTDLAEVMDKEVEALDKRAANRKPTKTQVENASLKAALVEALGEIDEPATATACAGILDVTVQKASALLRQMVAEGTVERTEGKGKEKTTFAVA